MTKTFCDRTGEEMTNPLGWLALQYTVLGTEDKETLILSPGSAARFYALFNEFMAEANTVDLLKRGLVQEHPIEPAV